MENAYSVLVGDNRQTLRELPDKSVHTVATSPPYWGLRDYGHDEQIGLEKTPEQYVATLVEVFREVRRVLRDDGTLWLNLGDSYAAAKAERSRQQSGSANRPCAEATALPAMPMVEGLKPKDLVGIPWRVAFALQADGWYLRQDIIWAKPNPMPESVQDRCTKAHEYVFLLTKQPRYFYDAEAVKESSQSSPSDVRKMIEQRQRIDAKHFHSDPGSIAAANPRTNIGNKRAVGSPTGRNRRSVWQVATAPCKEAHFATWPPNLVAPMIMAGTSEKGCCPTCGAQWQRVVERTAGTHNARWSEYQREKSSVVGGGKHTTTLSGVPGVRSTIGWCPSCTCGGEPVPCVVLDPFGGSGTTAGVANALGRRAILCELNPTYAEIIPRRVDAVVDAMRARKKVKRPKPNKLQKTLF